ncbi:MAG TPA: gliding motility-associated ABC transporter permease subunit GldF [Saprospiraceae bacterium]|nr:gliding motility-associated ABC transporter permease subunit GldF [Saprospiraceae bacterium]
MISLFFKEINSFFSSVIGYVVMAVFLLSIGLLMWVFPDFSIIGYKYATLDQLFDVAPMVFLFLIPAITMRSIAEERNQGTIEFLETKPLTDLQIIMAKFLAGWVLVGITLVPTLLFYYSVYQLGLPKGNLDSGAIAGSYLGLFLLGGIFTAIGIFASSLTKNQIVAFLLAALLSFIFYWGFDFLSRLPAFVGKVDDIVQMLGIEYHYQQISRGVIDSRNIIYFFSVMAAFVGAAQLSLEKRSW